MNPFEANEWSEVESSHILAIGTRDDDLIVQFKNGSAYLYPGLACHYPLLLSAESIGKYFHKEIRHQSSQRLQSE